MMVEKATTGQTGSCGGGGGGFLAYTFRFILQVFPFYSRVSLGGWSV